MFWDISAAIMILLDKWMIGFNVAPVVENVLASGSNAH